MKWENVYIFISSTFNDMHAERDYLIKRAFPKLKLWCNTRKLNLIDIDLRWGVSEKDATENKRVVDVCLNNLDKCRPFFIGLLGQRRGWVPQLTDINEQTLERFPGLSAYLGKRSITELEIIHGLIQSLDGTQKNMRHAFFLRRKPDYLEDITSEEVRQIYQSEDNLDSDHRAELENFKEALSRQYDMVDYDADWNDKKTSPELKNVGGRDLSAGRLEHFRIGSLSLEDYVADKLKAAIQEEFPEHFSMTPPQDELELELAHQETFLFNACNAYIPRPKEETKILDYFQGDNRHPYVLSAKAGTGKTSILAHLLQENQIPGKVFYRFVGTSSNSSIIDTTIYMLLEEMSRRGLLEQEAVQKKKDDILLSFRLFLEKIKGEACCIILDAVDQWNQVDLSSLSWLPEILPPNIKLLISVKSDGNEQILEELSAKGFEVNSLKPLEEKEEKILLIQEFLSQFLKDIDDHQIEHILSLEGSDNPLYLKVILNELRIHGSFDTLLEQFNKNYGRTPKEAFQRLLDRLERETFSDIIEAPVLTKYVLGIMAYSLESVALDDFVSIFKIHVFRKYKLPGYQTLQKEEIMDAVYGLTRHLSPYLVIDGNRAGFLYDSFRQAVRERYADSYEELQGILAVLYLEYCNPKGVMHYETPIAAHLTSVIYHSMEFSEAFAISLLTNPWYVYALLTKTSAIKTAHYFMLAHEKGYAAYDFETIGKFLKSIASPLDIGPNTLFYELRSKAGQNDAARILCETAEREMDIPYYYPVHRVGGEGLAACKEVMLHREDNFSFSQPFVQDGYIVYTDICSSTVVIQDLEQEDVIKKVRLRACLEHSYVENNYLYVWYSRNEIETFRLPSVESVFYQKGCPVLPEGFNWREWLLLGVDGQHYRYATKETDPLEFLVYHLNTGKVVIHWVCPEGKDKVRKVINFDVSLCGEYLMVYCGPYEIRLIWHVPTGKLVLEEKEFYYKMASEKNKLWFLTREDGKALICYVYEHVDGKIKLIRRKKLYSQRIGIKQIGVYDEKLCLFLSSGIVWVFDRDLQFCGSRKLEHLTSEDLLHDVVRYYHKYLYAYGKYLGVLSDSRLLFFDKEQLEANLQSEYLIVKNDDSAQVMIYDKNIAFLAEKSQKLDLRCLRVTNEDESYRFSYNTDNIYQIGWGRYVMGHTSDKINDYIQMISLEDMRPVLRDGWERPENMSRPVGEFFYDGKVGESFRDGRVGVILKEKEKHVRIIWNRHEKKKETEFVKYTVYYYEKGNLTDCWNPDIYTVWRHDPWIRLAGGIPYLVFRDVYIDERYSEIQIYDLTEKKLAFSYRYDLKKCRIKTDLDCGIAGVVQNDKLYVSGSVFEEDQMDYIEMAVEFDVKTGKVREEFFGMGDIRGWNDREVFCYKELFYEIEIYSLETDELIGTLKTRTSGYCYDIIRKKDDILVFFGNDILEVHDGRTYQFKYRQTYANAGIVTDCPGTDYIFVGNDQYRYCLYTLGSTKDKK